MEEKLTVLVVEPRKVPYEKVIDSGLASLQHEVGGYIEAIYPYADPVALVMDECGKLNRKPYNRALRDEDGNIADVIVGTFLVVGLGEESFASLSPELMEKYQKIFALLEVLINLDGQLVVIPVKESR